MDLNTIPIDYPETAAFTAGKEMPCSTLVVPIAWPVTGRRIHGADGPRELVYALGMDTKSAGSIFANRRK